jgi:PST family polysaccharide transporter
MSEVKNTTLLGIAWSLVSRVGRQVLVFGFGVVLMRLLPSEAFGLLTMITVVTGFAQRLFDLGFGAALVQHQDVREEHLSSVFWVNVGAGTLLAGALVAGAPLIADFNDEPLLVPLAMFMALNFLFRSMGVVHRTVLKKAIDFKALSIAEIGAVCLGSLVAVAMAYDGWGVWSLAVRAVLMGAAMTGLLWILSDWRPRFTFSWSAVRELLGFSLSLMGARTMNYWVRNLDDLLVGRTMGEGPLGIYRQSYKILLFPLRNVSRVISRVMFPSFSSIQGQKERIQRIYLKTTRVVALVTFPLMLGLLATTKPFVAALFGAEWMGMVPVLRILSVLGITQSIGTMNGTLYNSQGRADLNFKVGLFVRPMIIVGILVGVWGGTPVTVAAGYTATSLVASYVNFRFAGGLVNLTYFDLVRNLSSVFSCAALMSAMVFGLGQVLPGAWWAGARLAVQVAAGAATYGAFLHLFGVQAYRETWELLMEQREKFRATPSS